MNTSEGDGRVLVRRTERGRGGLRIRRAVSGAALAGVLVLGGCTMPESVNPLTWFGSDEEEVAEHPVGTPETASEETGPPSLATVPERPTRVTEPEARAEIRRGLVADRERAAYADDDGRRRPAVVRPLESAPPTPPPESEAAVPPPAPAPVETVTRADPMPSPADPPALEAPTLEPPASDMPPHTRPTTPTLAEIPAPPDTPLAEERRPVASAPAPLLPLEPVPPPWADQGLVGEVYVQRLRESSEGVFIDEAALSALDDPSGFDRTPSRERSPQVLAGLPLFEGMRDDPSGVYGRDFGVSHGFEEQGSALFAQEGFELLATVHFVHGSSHLNAEALRILREVSRIQQETGGLLRIEGHSSHRTRDMDEVSHAMANFQQSVLRADVVTAALGRLGVPDRAMQVEAKSDSEPLYREAMPSGEAGNRRTEIYIAY